MEKLQNENSAAGGLSDLTAGLGVFCWKPDTGRWSSGHVCYAGKWPVGKVAYTSRSKGDTEHQGAFMRLPGLKETLGYFATEEEARARVERAARYWIANLNTPNKLIQGDGHGSPAMAGSSRRTVETDFMELTELEEFEVLAEAFRIMTGYMAPGKDAAAASGAAPYEERREAFGAWMETNEECAAAIFMAIKRVTPNVEFSGGAPLHGAASAATQGYASEEEG